MQTNTIDNFINDIFDDFFVTEFMKNKKIENILKEKNFIKYQKEINNTVINYLKHVDFNNVDKLLKNNDSIHLFHEGIKRYIMMYVFLIIKYFYEGDNNMYIYNIVEFSKNQIDFDMKIENFFTSESTSFVIYYSTLLKKIKDLIAMSPKQLKDIVNNNEFLDALTFLNSFNEEFIIKIFKVKNKMEQAHNLIKTIIVTEIYGKKEKKSFYDFVESVQNQEEEFMYIDIVVANEDKFEYSSIESILSKKEIRSGLAKTIWKMIQTKDDENLLTADEKLLVLLKSKIIIPVCDDFLLFHKSSEKYDKNIDKQQVKKKEDTKLRFIVNKIDQVSELYSVSTLKNKELYNLTLKNFYSPLKYRKAILVNEYENINITNKYLHVEKHLPELEEYFREFSDYCKYPYVNFKDFEHYGFSLYLDNTIENPLNIVRYVNFIKNKEVTVNQLQMRIGSADMIINIVGFMFPSNKTNIYCINPHNVHNISKTTNGYKSFVDLIDHNNLGLMSTDKSFYWIFDLEKDFVKKNKYIQEHTFTKQEQVKENVANIYNDIINQIYTIVVNNIDKNTYIQYAYNIVKQFEYNLFKFPPQLLEKIEYNILNKVVRIRSSYDNNEDIIFGLENSIPLTNIILPELKLIPKININVTEEKNKKHKAKQKIKQNTEQNNIICQHVITWDEMMEIKDSDPVLFTKKMFMFTKKYIIENSEQDYVCRSCGIRINIKKFMEDGVYDKDTNILIPLNIHGSFEQPLEDVVEYERLKNTIRVIDKIIEKISVVSNIITLIGSQSLIKLKRKNITKDTIDLIIQNNNNLRKIFKTRNENNNSKYGIAKDLSNLFAFNLDDSIFIFSSKDKDYYKLIKQNNMLSMIILQIIMELTTSLVLTIGKADKKGLCGYQSYEKKKDLLFNDIKIIINQQNKVEYIKKYDILCYILFVITCSTTKYNMWRLNVSNIKEKTNKKNIILKTQKTMITTIIDMLNSIIENQMYFNNTKMTDLMIPYKIFITKYYRSLNETFGNVELQKRLKEESLLDKTIERKQFAETKLLSKQLSGIYKEVDYLTALKQIHYYVKIPPPIKHEYVRKIYNISTMTNCNDGKFHQWIPFEKTLKCKLCSVLMDDVTIKPSTELSTKFYYVDLQMISENFCIVDGLPHQFELTETGEVRCIRCHNEHGHIYSISELNELFEKIKLIEKSRTHVYDVTIPDNISTIELNKIDINYIDKFISSLNDIIGNDISLDEFNGQQLKYNTYIIDHDHQGTKLDKPIIISEKNNKVIYKQNHPFYKTDVIYYVNYKNGKIDVFYDATTLLLLGYKESDKNFVKLENIDKYLKINYSVQEQLKLLGFTNKFITVETNEKLKDIIRIRINNLKNIIIYLQLIINRINNNFQTTQKTNNDYFSLRFNVFDDYKKKIKNIDITNIFIDRKEIVDRMVPEYEKFNITSPTIINTENINMYEKNEDKLLNYFTLQLDNLIQQNKSVLPYLVIKFINVVYDMYNEENLNIIIDVKRFDYSVKNNVGLIEVSSVEQEESIESIKEKEEEEMGEDPDAYGDADAEYDNDGNIDNGENFDTERFD